MGFPDNANPSTKREKACWVPIVAANSLGDTYTEMIRRCAESVCERRAAYSASVVRSSTRAKAAPGIRPPITVLNVLPATRSAPSA